MTCQCTGISAPANVPPPPPGALASETLPRLTLTPLILMARFSLASIAAAWALVSSCGSKRVFAWRPEVASVRDTQSALTVDSPAIGRAEAVGAGDATTRAPSASAARTVMGRDGMATSGGLATPC